MAVLALDFDGVVSDSAPEAFVVAVRTWRDLAFEPALEAPTARLGGPAAPALAQVRATAIYAPFLEAMPLGNRAEDYAVVLGAVLEARALPDQDAYDACRAAWSSQRLADFHRRFYEVRTALAAADPAGWRALMAPYEPLPEILRRRARDTTLAIATAKDRASVRALLRAYGLDDLFDEARLFDKETGVSKEAHLRALHERCGVAFEDLTFIDDKVNHLDAVAHLGVRCVLAGWGYNGPREERLARERGYVVCTLDEAEVRLFPTPLGQAGESP